MKYKRAGGVVGNTSDSQSGDDEFKSHPVHQLENRVVFTGYPYCSEHGAMNKVSLHGMWRCLTCHIGYNEETNEFFKSGKEGFKKGGM